MGIGIFMHFQKIHIVPLSSLWWHFMDWIGLKEASVHCSVVSKLFNEDMCLL